MEIQEFLRFNRKSVDDRLVDTLVGLAMGIRVMFEFCV